MPGSEQSSLLVVGLCAAWCGSCREFRPAFEGLAAKRAGARFVWLDIEDDAALAGDIEVENFPMLAIYRGGVPVHFGPSLPQESVVLRLVDSLAAGGAKRIDAADAVAELPARLAAANLA